VLDPRPGTKLTVARDIHVIYAIAIFLHSTSFPHNSIVTKSRSVPTTSGSVGNLAAGADGGPMYSTETRSSLYTIHTIE